MSDLSKYLKIFRDEAREHIETLRRGLLALEEGGRDVAEILRCAHTLKGSSRMVGLTEIGNLAHKMEDVLKAVEKGARSVDRTLIDLLLESADTIRESVEAAARGDAETADLGALTERVRQAVAEPGAAADGDGSTPDTKTVPLEKPAPSPGGDLLGELDALFGPDDGHDDGDAAAPAPSPEPVREQTETPPPPRPTEKVPKPPPPPRATDTLPAPKRTPAGPDRLAQSGGPASLETIRVDVAKLDSLTNLAGELMINKIKIENKFHAVKEFGKDFLLWLEKEEQQEDAFEFLQEIKEKVREQLKVLTDNFFRDYKEMESLVNELQDATLELRLLPVSTIFDAYHRTVRDLRQALNKEAILRVTGREILLDKRILEEINPALIHLIRNALDHGIESPEERRARGKSPTGEIRLEAFSKGSNVVIRITDDGAGLDEEKIKARAVSKGIITEEEAADISRQETLNLVFRYGFSTSPLITDLSGRGVGLNVVWERVVDLKGNILLDSEPGEFTSVSLSFPPTYFTLHALLIQLGEEIVAIPSNFLEEIMEVTPGDVSIEGGVPVVQSERHIYPLIDMRRFLGMESPSGPPAPTRTIVAVKFKDEYIGMVVDKVLRLEEEVVKSSGPFLRHLPFVSGITILRYGEPCFILNMYDIFEQAKGWREGAEEYDRSRSHPSRRRVLAVDDSITTRTLEKNILEQAGYNVTTAISGEEALKIVSSQEFDIIITDVEMPGISGFELTEMLRASVRTKDVPVVIVTSLAKDEHRRRGVEVGAQAYIVKGTFDQTRLLETVRSLIG